MTGRDNIRLYWSLSDDDLSRLYSQAKADGALDVMAYDLAVSEDLFVLFARKAEVFGAVYGSKKDPLGFFYLTGFEGGTARIHFCLFRAGRADRLEIGRQVLAWCFETFEFQCLLGVVPEINQGAARFAENCGGLKMGKVPGFCWVDRLKRAVGGLQFLFTPPVAADQLTH